MADPVRDRLRIFLMVCQWQVLHSNQADAEARPNASIAIKKGMSHRIALQSQRDQSLSVVDLVTTTASEVAEERQLGTFHKLRGVSSGRRQWMMIHCTFNSCECS